MRLFALFLAAFLSWASGASAITGQLTAHACPGNPGASSVLNVDCAADSAIVIYATFATSHDMPDLIALDARFTLALSTSDLSASPFWNLDQSSSPCADDANAGRPVLGLDRMRPASGCTGFTDLFVGGGGTAYATLLLGPASVLIETLCYRATPLAVVAQQNLFGLQILIETVNAVERGGSCAGCGARATLEWSRAAARSYSSSTLDDTNDCPVLCVPPPLGTLTLNDQPVATQRRSWGQLKSLYR